jgi:hypothetical protein
MSEDQSTGHTSRPWHLWLVGILGFLWSGGGAFDYLMTQTQNEGYLSSFTPEQLDFFLSFPTWVIAFWALAVWGGVLGTVLLLLKKRWAVGVLLVSLVSMVVTTIHNYFLSDGMEHMGDPFSLVFTALIFLFSLGLFLYARAMKNKGVLV